MFHVVHDVKPLVVEGFKLIISIVIEHIKMMRVIENFSVIRGFEAYQNHCKQLSSLYEVSALPIHLVLHGHVIPYLLGFVTSIVNALPQSVGKLAND
jgi:hypothetical protein